MKKERRKDQPRNIPMDGTSLKRQKQKPPQAPMHTDSLDSEIMSQYPKKKLAKLPEKIPEVQPSPRLEKSLLIESTQKSLCDPLGKSIRISSEDPLPSRSKIAKTGYRSLSRKAQEPAQPEDPSMLGKNVGSNRDIIGQGYLTSTNDLENSGSLPNQDFTQFSIKDRNYSIQRRLEKDRVNQVLEGQIEENRKRNLQHARRRQMEDEKFERRYQKQISDMNLLEESVKLTEPVIQSDYIKNFMSKKTTDEDKELEQREKKLIEEGNPFMTRAKMGHTDGFDMRKKKFTNFEMNSPIEEISEDTGGTEAGPKDSYYEDFERPEGKKLDFRELGDEVLAQEPVETYGAYEANSRPTNNIKGPPKIDPMTTKENLEIMVRQQEEKYKLEQEKAMEYQHQMEELQYQYNERKNYYNYYDIADEYHDNADQSLDPQDKENFPQNNNAYYEGYQQPQPQPPTQNQDQPTYIPGYRRYNTFTNSEPPQNFHSESKPPFNPRREPSSPRNTPPKSPPMKSSKAAKNLEELSILIKKQKEQFRSECNNFSIRNFGGGYMGMQGGFTEHTPISNYDFHKNNND
jgi:hypothetical protein